MTLPKGARYRLRTWLITVRRRWWTRRALETLAAVLLLSVVATFAAVAYMAHWRFDEGAVSTARAAIYVLLPLAAAAIALPRLLRRLSTTAAARYVESRVPDLDALVVSAADVEERCHAAGRAPRPGSLEDILLERAADACARSEAVAGLESSRMRRAAATVAATVLAAAAVGLWGSAPLRHGLALLLAPSAEPAAGNPYHLRLSPGDAVLVAGDDQAVSARPEGFRPDLVELFVRSSGENGWKRLPMTPANGSDAHETLLFNLDGDLEYYARSGTVESPRHRLRVVPRPKVSRIDLRYEFPARTGRAPELVRDGGPIDGIRGTRVEVRVTPERPADGGELVLEDGARVALTRGDGVLRGVVELQRNGRYHIDLPAGAAGPVTASPEYPISVREDRRPTVTLQWPGRDARVSPIEEIPIRVRAEDDVAVRSLELVVNINGGEEQVVRFEADTAAPTVAGGTHLLSLEGLSLSPGDLISYHARATDAANEPDRLVSTDLYFMDVRPYEQRYHRAAGGGGGGGGGGGAGNAELTAQQRSLVVALFKLERDREIMDKATFQERAATLEQAQARIRDRVEAVVRRIAPRAFVSGNDGYRRMAEEMPRAARAMVETEAALAVRELPQALPRARKALLHLQRADAAFRDVQVAMQNSQGAGNGAQNELADLFRLEMDKFRNPYESLQRGQWNQPQKALDDALDKLRELARRQERELERARLRGERAQGGETSQQALAQEVEKLMRELQRLTRHRNQASAAQARKSLQDLEAAKRAMDRAGRNGDPEAAKQALERLQTVRRELERQQRPDLAQGIGEARQQAEAAVAEQRDIQRRLRNEDSRSTNPGDEDDRTTAQRQRALADDVRRLSREIAGLQRRARGENRTEAASELEAAGRALRQRQVEARLRRAAEALEQGESTGAGESSATGEDLEAVRQRLARAEGKVRAQGAPDAEDTLERLQAMVRSLKAEQQRLTDAANRGDGGSTSGERSRAGAPSASGGGAAGDG
ncbi:MAG: hypothetical protein PVF40_04645, partial [Ectothiorhodospiraceae bacterium]